MPKYSKYLSYKEPLKFTYGNFLKKFNFNDKQIESLTDAFIEPLESFEETVRDARSLSANDMDKLIKEQLKFVYKNTMNSILKEKINEQKEKKTLIVVEEENNVDATFLDEFNSFMNSFAKRVYIPALNTKPNAEDIKEYYKKDEETFNFVKENCTYADDVINIHYRKNEFNSTTLRNEAYDILDKVKNGNKISNKEKLLANYIAMKKEYSSHNPFYNFFLGGRSRIAMRAMEKAIKENYMVKDSKEDVYKFAVKNVGPSKELYNIIDSANPINKAVYNKKYDTILESNKILMEAEKKDKSNLLNKSISLPDYNDYKKHIFDKVKYVYENGSKLDINKLNGESYKAYYEYVNMINAEQNNAKKNEKQRQFNELKNGLKEVVSKINESNKEANINIEKISKEINSRNVMLSKITELCDKYNIENKYTNIIDDEIINKIENKKMEIEVPEYDPNFDLDSEKDGKVVALDKKVNEALKNNSLNRMKILVEDAKEPIGRKEDADLNNDVSELNLNKSEIKKDKTK